MHYEIDYRREAATCESMAQHVADLPGSEVSFHVPRLYRRYCTGKVLAMEYVTGKSVTDPSIQGLSLKRLRSEADYLQEAQHLATFTDLLLQEFFELRLVQTDPNLANYRYQSDSGKIVLLDFGATRKFKAGFVNDYKRMMNAFMAGHDNRLLAAAEKLGYLVKDANAEYRQLVLQIFKLVLEPLTFDGAYDFGGFDLSLVLPRKQLVKSFKCKYTEQLFEGRCPRRFLSLRVQAERKLILLHSACTIEF